MNVIQRKIPLLDLQAQHKQIREETLAAVVRVIDSQVFILGEEVKQLEQELAPYCGSRHAIGCASGSDALVLALMALEVGPGDGVLTVPYSFFATAGAISRVGATPVFVGIEEGKFNVDVNSGEDMLSSQTKMGAIIPVHLFGGCADMDPLMEIAGRHGIPVVEDGAQSIGAEYKGRRAGGIGQIGCFSFFPSNNLGGYGDGGLVTTNDDSLAARLTALRAHGSRKKYYHEWIGFNSRLDSLQAAVLRVKLRSLDKWSDGRSRNADIYRAELQKRALPVTAPRPAAYQTRHIYNQFVIRGDRRDALQARLKERGVGSEVYYPLPLHLQPCYAFLGHKVGDFQVSEKLAQDSLALPIHSELERGDIEYVCEVIGEFYAS